MHSTICRLLTIVMSFAFSLNADEPEMRWGIVPHEHLIMDGFEQDPDASVVILFDRGDVTIEDDLYVRFTRHRRIKILTSHGFSWGTFSIRYRAEGRTQRVRDIEGQTINLNADGTVSRHPLEGDGIFDESIDGKIRRIRFTLPALQEGSVIEYRYTVTSDHPIYFPDWTFQTDEPVLWSEFCAKVPNLLGYVVVTEGAHPMYKREQSTYIGRDQYYSGRNLRWAMKDLPAIRPEPYISSVDDYKTKLRTQLAEIHYPGRHPVKVLRTWEEIIEILLGSSFYGRDINGPRQIRRLAREITEGIRDPHEKMNAIYRYIQNTIVWSGRYSVVPSGRMHTVLNNNSGDSADIALLLTAMLRSVDFEADMVILSTRGNGRLQRAYPLVEQFNHAITRVKLGGTYYLLDARSPYLPAGVLPVESINEVGLLVKKGTVEWIGLNTTEEFTRRVFARIDLEESGTLSGEIRFEDTGYSAHPKRRGIANNDDVDHLRSLLSHEYEIFDVDDYSIENRTDIDKPLVTTMKISSSEYAHAVSEHIYLNPFISGRMRENNLKLRDRTFPVEFVYRQEVSLAVDLNIPQGYEILEMPGEISISLRQNGAQYRRVIREEDGVIQIRRHWEINQVLFEPREYGRLRNFFERVVSHDSEQIVLRRIDSVGDAQPGSGN